MSWTTPVIHSTGDVVTASDWNIGSNDLTFLSGSTSAFVATGETTTSASYTDLATAGPAVTLTTGVTAIVLVSAEIQNNTSSDYGAMSFAVSGATTAAASDSNRAVFMQTSTTTAQVCASTKVAFPSLTAGSNTFTAKYRVNAGTATFTNRTIVVIPLP